MSKYLKNIFFYALEIKFQVIGSTNVKRTMSPAMPVSDTEAEEHQQPKGKETEEPVTISSPGKYL